MRKNRCFLHTPVSAEEMHPYPESLAHSALAGIFLGCRNVTVAHNGCHIVCSKNMDSKVQVHSFLFKWKPRKIRTLILIYKNTCKCPSFT